MKKISFKVSGMHCASCSATIQRSLQKKAGVLSAVVNIATEKATVEYDEKLLLEKDIFSEVEKKGYGVIKESSSATDTSKKELASLKMDVIGSTIFAIPVFILGMFFMSNQIPFQTLVMWILTTPIQFYYGRRFYKGSYLSLKGGVANMDTLIAMGSSQSRLNL